MKRAIFLPLLALVCSGLVFAEFEGTFGLYGGFGNAGAAGLNLQLGYLSPAVEKSGTNEEPVPVKFRWGVLFDSAIGYGGWGLKG
jgi:hypothetical protein